jgi:hypothetical protein
MYLVYGLIFGVTVITLGIMIIVYVFRYTKEVNGTSNLSQKYKKQVFEVQALSIIFFLDVLFGVSANVVQQISSLGSPVYFAFDLTKYGLIATMSILVVSFLASVRNLILLTIDSVGSNQTSSVVSKVNSTGKEVKKSTK